MDAVSQLPGMGRLRKDKLALRFFEMSYKMRKDDPDLYYYWGIAMANTGQIEKSLEKWNIIGYMYNPRLEDYVFRARKILVGKREYCRFEYITDL